MPPRSTTRWIRAVLGNPGRKGRPTDTTRLALERLEDRLAPATQFLYQAGSDAPLRLDLANDQLRVVNAVNGSVLAWQALQNTSDVLIKGDKFDVRLTIDATVPAVPGGVRFDGGSGNTALVGPAATNTWVITGSGAGWLNSVRFTGVDLLVGGPQNDTYHFDADSALGRVAIDESAGGINSLDFSTTSAAVTVDLARDGWQTVNSNLELSLGDSASFHNVTGGSGNDRLTGNDLNNVLVGGPGNDTLDGGGGDDTYVFASGWGSDVIKEKSSAGTDTFDLSAVTSNITVTMTGNGTFSLMAGGGAIQAEGIERLVAGPGTNALDYSAYPTGVSVDLARGRATGLNFVSGFRNVTGSAFDDTLVGDGNANVLRGGAGDDRISGGGGADTLDGGTGTNTLFEARDVNFTLTNTTLTATGPGIAGSEVDSIANFQRAELTGGTGPNVLDASAFTLGGVVLDGGSTVPLSLLNGGSGVRTTDLDTLNLLGRENATLLSSLNQGDGVRTVSGHDFRIHLTDGRTVDVNVSFANTLQDVFIAIVQAGNGVAPGRLSVGLDEVSGDAIVLRDAGDLGRDLRVEALNNSLAAADLGILRTGVRTVLVGTPISSAAADVRVRTSDGQVVDIDLSFARTVQDVIDAFDVFGLSLAVNADGTGLDLRDHAGGGGNLVVSNLNGSFAASDLGIAGTGTGALLRGASIVTGSLRLDGRGAADVLIGTIHDDTLILAGGNSTVNGGGGLNTLVVGRDADLTLTNTSLTVGTSEVSSLANIQRAKLTGGPSNNRLDASAFTLGSVALIGGDGDDVLIGGSGDDFLSGGRGIDSLDGGGGTNTVVEFGHSRFVLTDTSLDLGEGTNHVVAVHLTGTVTGGTFQLTFGGQTTRPIPFDADAFYVKSRLTALPNIDDNDVTVTRLNPADPWTITFRGKAGGMSQPTLTASGIDLVGGGVLTAVVTAGVVRVNTLANIQRAELVGGDGGSLMDASAFSGSVVLIGGAGDDVLIGGAGNDILRGRGGNDRLTGNGGNDVLDGGAGLNTLVESRDVNFVLSNSTLTVNGTETDTLISIHRAELTGGASNNTIDARAFSGLSATTDLSLLRGGQGIRTTAGVTVSMTGLAATMALSLLNNGAGVRTVAGNDLRITLTTGTQINVNLGSATTLQGAFDAIQQAAAAAAPGRLSVGLNQAGTAIVLKDTVAGGGNLTVTALNGSPAAVDLGLLGAGVGPTLEGSPLTDGSSDIRITLTDGTRVNIDLSGLTRIQDVLDAITAAHPRLQAQLNAGQTALVISDTAGGAGRLQVSDINGSQAAADLGILGTAPVGSNATLTGTPIGIGSVRLDGGAGNDTLYGSPGDDFLTGGTGSNTLVGGGGIDTVVESRDADFTLTNSSLTIGSDTSSLSGISRADLSGGAGVNTLDASAFTLGPVTLRSGGGLDTLRGGTGADQFIIDVTGLTRPFGPSDTARQVTVIAGSPGDQVIVEGTGTTLLQADAYWVNFGAAAPADYKLRGGRLALGSDLILPGQNITIEADHLEVTGRILSVSSTTGAAGNITLQANHILIGGGAQLLAEGATPAQNGSISLLAIDDRAAVQGLGFANIDLIETSINVGAATIRGGAVTLRATADSQRLLLESDFGTNPVGQLLGGKVLGGIALALEGLSAGAGVAVARSSAKIDVGTDASVPTTIVADSFTSVSTAKTYTLVQPIAVLVSAAVGIAVTDSQVNVGNARITTVNDFTVRATTEHVVDILADATGIAGAAAGVGVSIVVSNTAAQVGPLAQLTVGRDLYVQADTTDRGRVMARSTTGGDGSIGLAFAVGVRSTDTIARLDGDADVARNVNVTARQQTLPIEINKALALPSYSAGVYASAGTGTNSTGDFLDDLKGTAIGAIVEFVAIPAFNNTILRFVAWVKSKLGYEAQPTPDAPKSVDRPSFQAAASVAVVVEQNRVESRIGDGSADPAAVNVGGFLTVAASIVNPPYLGASSSTTGGGDSTTLDGKTKVAGQSRVGVSLAVTVGDLDDRADAYIAGNAVVNVRGALRVTADALNVIDPASTFGSNLVAPFRSASLDPTYTTDDGVQVLNEGDVVGLVPGYAGGGDAGTTYRYVGLDGAEIDLGQEDYTNANRWQAANLAADAILGFVRTLTTYLGSNLGLDNNLFNSGTQATSLGQGTVAIAGAFTVIVPSHTAHATIRDGARVNQDAAFASGTQTVQVLATSENDLVQMGGNFQLPSLTNVIGADSGLNFRQWSFDRKAITKFSAFGVGGEDTPAAIGVTVLVYRYVNDVRAVIEDGVRLSADSLHVDADNRLMAVTLGASGGRSEDFGFNGVGLYQGVRNTTLARVGGGATIVIGSAAVMEGETSRGASLVVEATDTTHLISVAGSLAVSERTGVGASAAINDVRRRTEAYIGSSIDAASLPTGGSLSVGGNVLVSADNKGFIGAFAVAGAAATGSPEVTVVTSVGAAVGLSVNFGDDVVRAYVNSATVTATGDIVLSSREAPTYEAFSIGGAYAGGNRTGIAVAGSASVNSIDTTVEAFIRHSGVTRHVTSTFGSISLTAVDDSGVYSQAGAVSFAWGSQTDARAVSVGASVVVNEVKSATRAFLDGARVQAAGTALVQATNTSDVLALTVTGGGSGSVGGFTTAASVTVAGAISVNVLSPTVEALLRGGSDLTAGTVRLNAVEDMTVVVIAGAGAGAGAAGGLAGAQAIAVGAASAVNVVTDTVRVAVTDSAIHAGSLFAAATRDTEVVVLAFGLAGGGSTSSTALSVAAAGSAVVNVFDGTVETTFTGSDVTASGAALLTALDTSVFFALAGSAVGAGAAGVASGKAAAVGASLVVNVLTTTVRTGLFQTTLSASALTMDATSELDVVNAAIGFAGGGAAGGSGGIAVAGSGAGVVNVLTSTVTTDVQGGRVTTTQGGVSLRALDDTSLVAAAGAAAGSGAGGGSGLAVSAQVGASFAVNSVDATVRAAFHNAVVQAAGDVTVSAEEKARIIVVTVGFAGGGSGSSGPAVQIAAAGSGSGNSIDSSVTASVTGGSITTPGSLAVSARDTAQIVVVAGGVAAGAAGSSNIAVAAAIGIAAATSDIEADVKAVIDGATVNATAGVSVTAISSATVEALTLGGAVSVGASGGSVGVGIGAAGAGSGNAVRNTVVAAIQGSSQVQTGGGVTLTAQDTSVIKANAGGVGIAVGVGGGGVGVGASLGVAFAKNDVDNVVRALVADSNVTATGPVSLTATEATTIEALTIGGAVAVGAGQTGVGASVAGAGSFNTVNNTVEATISGANRTVRSTGGAVSLSASDTSNILANAGGVGLAVGAGATAGVGVTVGFSAASNEIANRVRSFIDATQVHAAGNVALAATSSAAIEALTIGGAVAVGAGQAGVGVGGAGAGSGNEVRNEVMAAVRNGSVVTSGAALSLHAHDFTTITANGGAVGVAVGAGQVGVGASLGVGFASNDIRNQVKAYLDNATVTAFGGVELIASESASIKALSIGGAAAVGAGLGGVAIAGAGAGSYNTIRNVVQAYTSGGSVTVTGSTGFVTVLASDVSNINASAGGVAAGVAAGAVGVGVTVGASVLSNDVANLVQAYASASQVQTAGGGINLLAFETVTVSGLAIGGAATGAGGVFGGVALSGAGADASNTVANRVEAFAQAGSHLVTAGSGNITIRASDTTVVDARAVAGALAAGYGALVGAGAVAIGASVANNDIASSVLAYSEHSTVTAGGSVQITASSSTTASVLTVAASVAVAIGPTSLAFAGGGADSDNRVNNTVRASVTGGSVSAGVDVAIDAAYTPVLLTEVGTGTFAGAGLSASVSISLADTIDTSAVRAYVESGAVAAGRHATVQANAGGGMTTTAVATSVALTGPAGAGAAATSVSALTVEAYTAGSATVDAGQDVLLSADSTGSVNTNTLGVAGGLLAIGVSLATAALSGRVEARPNGWRLAAGRNVRVHGRSQSAVSATARALSGGIIAGFGARADATNEPSVLARTEGATQAGGNVTVEAMALPSVYATALGGSFGAVTIGMSLARGIAAPKVEANLRGSTVTTGGDVTATAQVNILANDANARAAAGGILAALSGAQSDAISGPVVDATVGSGATVNAARNFTLSASSTGRTTATTDGITAAGILAGSDRRANAAVGTANLDGIISVSSRPAWTKAAAQDQANITAGGSLSILTDSSQAVTSFARGAVGALIAGAGATAITARNVPTTTSADQRAVLTAGGDVTISARNGYALPEGGPFGGIFAFGNNVVATASNDVGGFVAAGKPTAKATVNDSTDAAVGPQARVTARAGNVVIRATAADFGISSQATAKGGGVIAIVDADATTTVNNPATARVGEGATLAAGTDLLVEATTGRQTRALANASGKGLGAVSDAHAVLGGTASARSEVGRSASLTAGRNLEVLAREKDRAQSYAFAEVTGGAGIIKTHATAEVGLNHYTFVVVDAGAQLHGPSLLRLSAEVGTPSSSLFWEDRAEAVSDAGGFAGSTNADATTVIRRSAEIFVVSAQAPGETPTRLRTSNLQVVANAYTPAITTLARREGFVLIDTGGSKKTAFNVNAAPVSFYADVTITGPATFVRIDPAGNVTATPNVGIDKQPGWYAVSPVDATTGGQATLRSSSSHFSIVTGVAHFNFDRGSGGVTIINEDTSRNLIVGDVAVTAAAPPTPRLTISPQGPSDFTTSASDDGGTPVTITSASDVVLTGVINNPRGPVSVTAPNGTIASARDRYVWIFNLPFFIYPEESAPALRQQIVSPQVTLAGAAIGSPGSRVSVRGVQTAGSPALTATTTGDQFLNLSTANPLTPLAATLSGRVLDLAIGDSGTASSYALNITAAEVNAAAGLTTPVSLSITAAGDLAAGTIVSRLGDVALTAGGAIRATQPGGAADVSGRNLILTAGTTIGPLVIDSTGVVTATADEAITLDEAAGDLSLDRVRSFGGTITLNAAGRILDGRSGTTAANVETPGRAILTAQGIGVFDRRLQTSVRELQANSGAGDLYVHDAGDLTIPSDGPFGLLGRGIDLTVGGSLNVEQVVAASGPISLGAGNALHVRRSIRTPNTITLAATDVIVHDTGTVQAGQQVWVTVGQNGSRGTVLIYGVVTAQSGYFTGGTGNDNFTFFQVPRIASVLLSGGGGGEDDLSVYGTAGNDTFNVTATSIELAGVAHLSYATPFYLTRIHSLTGHDTFNVSGTSSTLETQVFPGGDTTLNLSTNDAVNRPLMLYSVHGAINVVNVTADYHSGAPYGNDLTVSGGDARGLGLQARYQAVTAVNVRLIGQATDLTLTGLGLPTTVQAGAAAHSITVGTGDLAGLTRPVTITAVADSGTTLRIDNRTGTNPAATLTATSAQGLGGGGPLTFTGIDALTVDVGAGALDVLSTITGPVTIHAGQAAESTTVRVVRSVASQLSLFSVGSADGVVFDGSAETASIDATLADGTAAGSTTLSGLPRIGPATFTGFATARLLTGSGNDTISLRSTVPTLHVTASGGAGDDVFTVHRVAVPADPTQLVSMAVDGDGGNDTVHVLIPGAPGDDVYRGLIYLRPDVERLVVDNTANPHPVNWVTTNGVTLGYDDTRLLDISHVDDLDVRGGSSALNTLRVDAGGIGQKATIDGNTVTMHSAGFLQFTRLTGTVASYTEGNFTLRSVTPGGAPNLTADNSLLPAVRSADPSSAAPIRLTANDGGLFTLHSVDFAGTGTVTLIGTTVKGQTVTAQFDVSSPTAFQTFTLDPSFSMLVSVFLDVGNLLTSRVVATQTLRGGTVNAPNNTIYGSMPAAPQDIVFRDLGAMTIDGVEAPLLFYNPYIGLSVYLFNGTPVYSYFSYFEIETYPFSPTQGTPGSKYARSLFFFGDLNIPAGSTVTFLGHDAISLVAQDDINVGANVTFIVPPGEAGGGQVPPYPFSSYDADGANAVFSSGIGGLQNDGSGTPGGPGRINTETVFGQMRGDNFMLTGGGAGGRGAGYTSTYFDGLDGFGGAGGGGVALRAAGRIIFEGASFVAQGADGELANDSRTLLGKGGVGGAGAGGTIQFYGTAVYADGNVTIDTSGGVDGDGNNPAADGRFVFGSNTATVSPTLTGDPVVFNNGAGPVFANPYIAGTPSTPSIAGLTAGAAPYGLLSDPQLLQALATSSVFTSALTSAPGNALATVFRLTIPAGFDQYTGYDLVVYANLTDAALPGPRLGITQGSADASYATALAYGAVFTPAVFTTAAELYTYDLAKIFMAPFGAPDPSTNEPFTTRTIPLNGTKDLGAIPGHGIFVTLVPSADPSGGQFVNASIAGAVNNVAGAAFDLGAVYHITLPAVDAPQLALLRTYRVSFSSVSSLTVTATGSADHVINQLSAPPVSELTIDLSAATGNAQVNLLDSAGGVPGQVIRVTTGAGNDQVHVHAAQPNHTFLINTGPGADTFVLTGNAAANGGSSFQVNLGSGNDTAQVAGAQLSATLSLTIDGGEGTDTLLYDAADNPTTPDAPATPDGSLTLQNVSVATVDYQSIEAIPGFVAGTSDVGGPYAVNQGQALTLHGTATAATNTQIVSIAWDLDGDGIYLDATDPSAAYGATGSSSPTVPWSVLRALGLGLAGTYTIAMRVTSTTGVTYEYTALTVHRVAPTVTLNAPADAPVSRPFTVSFAADFPGGERPSGFVVTWGDGSSTTLPADATQATHTYTAVGTFPVKVTVVEGGTNTDSATRQVNVGVAPDSLRVDGPYAIDAGDGLTLTVTAEGAPTMALLDLLGQGTYTDATAAFTDNGDGTSTATITLTWAQLRAAGVGIGGYPGVTVRALYGTDTMTSAPTTLTVNDVAPTAAFGGTATEGGTGSVSFSSVFHPALTTGFLYSYDVGDTGTFQVTDSTSSTFDLPAEALYRAGSVVVRGRVATPDGAAREYLIAVTITNQAPSFVAADGDRTVNANEVLSLVNFTFTDPGQDTITALINWGDGTTSAGVITQTSTGPAPTTGTVSASHAYAYRPQPYTVTVTLQDAAGATAAHTFDVTVLDPVLSSVDAGNNLTTSEGGRVELAGTFIDLAAPSTYSVSVDWGDGTVNTAPVVIAPRTAAEAGRVFDSHHYGKDGTYTVTLTVTKAGQAPISSTFEVTVTDVAPTVVIAPLPPGGPGVPVTLHATFSDPSFPVNGEQESFETIVYWGDGTSSLATVQVTPGGPGVPTTGTITATHQYAGNGPYEVSLAVGDGPVTGVGRAAITNAPPTVTVGSDIQADEGGPVTLLATFSDPGFDFGGITKSFTASIDWGDGTITAGVVTVTPGDATTPTTGTVTGGHTYPAFGTYAVIVRVTDEGGAEGSATLQAMIDNLAPVVAALPAAGFSPQAAFLISGTFTDPGLGNTHTVTVDWGDGTTSTFDANTLGVDEQGNPVTVLAEPTATSPGTFQIGHVYSGTDDYTVTVTVTDNGGLSAQVSRVYAVRLLLTGVTPPTDLSEGEQFSGPVATFTRPGRTAADFLATVRWGDGTTSTVSGTDGGIIQNADGSFTVNASHVYADDATDMAFEVEVTDLTNADLLSAGGTVTVKNVAPTLELSPVPVVDEGSPVSLLGRFTDPGLLDTHELSIAWGNPDDPRDSVFALLATRDLSLNQSFRSLGDDAELTITGIDPTTGEVQFRVQSHTYLDDRATPYPVTAQVKDNGNESAQAGVSVTVLNVSPVVSLTATTLVRARTRFRLRIEVPVDPGRDTVTRYRVNWGDGKSNLYTAAQLARLTRLVPHVYAKPGRYTITVDVQDEDGWHLAAGSRGVTVVAPQIVGPATVLVGRPLTLTGVSNAPQAVNGGLTFRWVVIDPTGRSVASGEEAGAQPQVRFTPTRAGLYTVRLTIRDEFGGVVTITRSIRAYSAPILGRGGR